MSIDLWIVKWLSFIFFFRLLHFNNKNNFKARLHLKQIFNMNFSHNFNSINFIIIKIFFFLILSFVSIDAFEYTQYIKQL